MQKKLQVFISSTYKDLQPERAAAVRSILDAGHMPSGMEAFAAGNASVWETIKEWIDSCDALMVIVGGRYGEVDTASGKSFTQLEYEYAQERHKEVFALVLSKPALDAKAKALGADAHDEHGEKLKGFRDLVLKKMGAIVDDPKDVKVETMKALAAIAKRDLATGWVSGAAIKQLTDENTVLASENAALREAAKERGSDTIPFGALLRLLETDEFDFMTGSIAALLLLHSDQFMQGVSWRQSPDDDWLYKQLGPRLQLYGLVDLDPGEEGGGPAYMLNQAGRVVVISLKAQKAGVKLPFLPETRHD